MHYHILLRQYSQNYYTYNSVVKYIYSPCHKDARVQISIGNTEWLLHYKGVSQTYFSGEKAYFHRERWLGETPLGSSSWPRIAWSLMVSNNYQHLDIINEILWHSFGDNFNENYEETNYLNVLKTAHLKLNPHILVVQELIIHLSSS